MINKAKQYLGLDYNGKLKLMDYYNRHCYPYIDAKRKYKIQPNDDWCAMFTTVIANMCGLGAENFPYEVSVWYQAEWAKKRGLWFTDASKAKPNDLIVYDWNKGNRYNHVGFVVEVNRISLKAIEGNKSNTVGYRTVNIASSQIKGFIRIDTVDKNYPDLTPNLPVLSREDKIAILAMRTVLGVHGNGNERKIALGNWHGDVQRLINLIDTKI